MISKIISRASRAACLAELTSNPKSFSNCPDLHGGVAGLPGGSRSEGTLASLGQASLEFVHANNPIPEVASRRRTRMDRILSRMSSRSPSAFETAEKRQTPFGIASNTSTSSDHRRAPVTPSSVSNHFDQLDLRAPPRARLLRLVLDSRA